MNFHPGLEVKRLALVLFFKGCILTAAAQQDSLQKSVAVSYEQTSFSKQFSDDWRVFSLEYGHKTTAAAFIAKINYAERFALQGVQFEGQAYPKLSQKLYAYLGASFSNNNPVFPVYTTGATLYLNIGKGWELEGGYRQLNFNENIWIGTGGVSKYAGNWLFNLRSFISLDKPASNQSYFFTAKRFFGDRGEMIWLQAGSGLSPDEKRNVQLTMTNLLSKRLGAGTKFFVWKNTQVLLTGGYSRDEYKEKTFGDQWSGSAGFAFLF